MLPKRLHHTAGLIQCNRRLCLVFATAAPALPLLLPRLQDKRANTRFQLDRLLGRMIAGCTRVAAKQGELQQQQSLPPSTTTAAHNSRRSPL